MQAESQVGQFRGIDHLNAPQEWTPEWAHAQAKQLNFGTLKPHQLELLHQTREIWAIYQALPPTRLFLKALSSRLGETVTMLRLVAWMECTDQPVHLINFLAGLPPLAHCL